MSLFKIPKTSCTTVLSTFALLFLHTHAFAESVIIPITRFSGLQTPANDLLYQERVLDRDEALDLHEQGQDLSKIDPIESDVWKNHSYPAQNLEPSHYPESEVQFESLYNETANSVFMSRVTSPGQTPGKVFRFKLMASTQSHGALMRAAALRVLGYPIPSPKLYSSLKVNFETTEQKNQFLDGIVAVTLTARERWIESQTPTSVTLHDVVLERAQIDVPQYHWGIIGANALFGRRITRALLLPLVWLDLTESINQFSFSPGRMISGAILFNHPFAPSFEQSTFEDLRWIARKIALLSDSQLAQIARAAGLPHPVEQVVLQKVIARRNQLVQLFNLSHEMRLGRAILDYSPRLDIRDDQGRLVVEDGKVKRESFDHHADRFLYGDPESPLRASEVGRFVAVSGINGGLQSALNQMNTRLLNIMSQQDILDRHNDRVREQVWRHFVENPTEPYVHPIQVFGGATGGMSINASRNVVSGTYYGSDAKVQMVDQMTISHNMGFFLGVSGIQNIQPTLTSQLIASRSIVHVKPLPDMKTAIRDDWTNVWTPKFMDSLGALLNVKASNTQAEAQAKLDAFLAALKTGEMLIISESIGVGTRGSVAVPIPLLMAPGLAQFNPSVSLAISSTPTELRRITLMRTEEGIQIYINDVRIANLDITFDFNWWINIFRFTHIQKRGSAETEAYLIATDELTPEQPRPLAIALKALLTELTVEPLHEVYPHFTINHRLRARLDRTRLLNFQHSRTIERHRMSAYPPGHPEQTRTLYSHRMVRTRGVNNYDFFTDVIRAASQGIVNIPGQPGASANPASSFMGFGSWVSVMTEQETTPGRALERTAGQGMLTTLEHHWGGWLMRHDRLLKVFDEVEALVRPYGLEKPLINRDEFAQTKRLQLYDINSTLLIYQEGLTRFRQTFLETSSAEFERLLDRLDGNGDRDRWKRKLKRIRRRALRDRNTPNNIEETIDQTNELIHKVEKIAGTDVLIRWIGIENLFFQVRVSGFRVGDEAGDVEYISDSVGMTNPRQGTGAFREFASRYGISLNELYARYLSEGF